MTVSIRVLDARSHRRHERLSPGRAIRRVPLSYCGFQGSAWCDRMSELAARYVLARWPSWMLVCCSTWSGCSTGLSTSPLPRMVDAQSSPQFTLTGANPVPIAIPQFAPDELNFLESVEAAHSSHSFNDTVAKILNVTRPPTRMDSQAKYCALARGDGAVYLRMPTGVGYKEKIWVRNAYV
jgi:hypothetical protein